MSHSPTETRSGGGRFQYFKTFSAGFFLSLTHLIKQKCESRLLKLTSQRRKKQATHRENKIKTCKCQKSECIWTDKVDNLVFVQIRASSIHECQLTWIFITITPRAQCVTRICRFAVVVATNGKKNFIVQLLSSFASPFFCYFIAKLFRCYDRNWYI